MSILDKNLEEVNFCITDFETTGLSPYSDEIVEVSMIKMNGKGDVLEVFDSLVKPYGPVYGTEIHGISDDDVVNAPRIHDLHGVMSHFINDSVFCAYNVYFDYPFFKKYFLEDQGMNDIPYLCAMYARGFLPNPKSKTKLINACKERGIELRGDHGAVNDSLATASLFKSYLNEIKYAGATTFNDLKKKKKYKFIDSWAHSVPTFEKIDRIIVPVSRNFLQMPLPAGAKYNDISGAKELKIQIIDRAKFSGHSENINYKVETEEGTVPKLILTIEGMNNTLDQNEFNREFFFLLIKLFKSISQNKKWEHFKFLSKWSDGTIYMSLFVDGDYQEMSVEEFKAFHFIASIHNTEAFSYVYKNLENSNTYCKVKDILEAFKPALPESLDDDKCFRYACRALTGEGIGIEPELRNIGRDYGLDQMVGLIKLPHRPIIPRGKAYLIISDLLRMSIRIAVSDGCFDQNELELINNVINEHFYITENESLRLSAAFEIYTKYPESLEIAYSLRDSYSLNQRIAMAKFLVVMGSLNGIDENVKNSLQFCFHELDVNIQLHEMTEVIEEINSETLEEMSHKISEIIFEIIN